MATLNIIDGAPNNYHSFEIEKSTTTVGRHGDFRTPRFNQEVSRIHCVLMHDDFGGYQIRDANSTFGTAVNGKSIGSKSKTLHSGDKVSLGNNLVMVFSR